jgi:glutathione S-transferase
MALVTAHEVGLADRVELIATKVEPTRANADLSRIAPLGKIPVLVTDHGHALYDSRVIMEYLCHISGDKALIPDDGVKRFRILTLLALGQGLAESAVAFRYETAVRPHDLRWQGWIDRTRVRVKDTLDELEKAWSAPLSECNAGSIAVAVSLAYIDFRLPQWDWRQGRSGLEGFFTGFSARHSMVATRLG